MTQNWQKNALIAKKIILLPLSDVSELIGDVLLVLLVVLFFFLSLRFFLFSLINFTFKGSERIFEAFERTSEVCERTFKGRGCKIYSIVGVFTISRCLSCSIVLKVYSCLDDRTRIASRQLMLLSLPELFGCHSLHPVEKTGEGGDFGKMEAV